MATTIQPWGERIIVRRVKPEDMSSGAHGTKIVLPQTSREQMDRGTIVSVGPELVGSGRLDGAKKFLQLSPGQEIIFGKFAGVAIEVDGEELQIMNESDVLAIVNA